MALWRSPPDRRVPRKRRRRADRRHRGRRPQPHLRQHRRRHQNRRLDPHEGTTLVVEEPGLLANDWTNSPYGLSAGLFYPDGIPLHGQVQIVCDGEFFYTPSENFIGTDSFVYVAEDNCGDGVNPTVTIDVVGPPTAVGDAYSVDEDSALDVDSNDDGLDILSNDSNVVLAFAVTGPSHGALGGDQYVPSPNFSGIDSFTYAPRRVRTTSRATQSPSPTQSTMSTTRQRWMRLRIRRRSWRMRASRQLT